VGVLGACVSNVFFISNGYSSTGLTYIGLITGYELKFVYPTELGRFVILMI
jgi:hypothetical protein